MSQYKIAPSILAADYANFEREIKRLEATGAEYAHIDIMDSHFVPQISFGAGVVESLRPHSKMVFDCHLMVSNPEHHLEDFARAGADIISIHVEATPHIHGALQKIRSLGVKPSVVINPGTPVEAIKHVLHLVDQVLVMTVNPGFGGQAFLPETMDKVRELVALRQEKGLNFEIEVDGGIDDQTIAQAKEAGATEVHVAIGSPALAYPCFYGIDIQTRQELIAANHTVEETRQIIGADSLTYLSIDGLIESIGIETDAPNGGLCVAYFDGDYPTPLYDYEEDYRRSLEEKTSFYK